MPPQAKPYIETPLIESAALSKAAGCRIFLKLENLQPSGSFKSRGIGHIIQKRLLESPNPHLTHFYSSSGGNAGLACVHAAARCLGRPATVVVPLSTKPLMLARLRAAGATEVLQVGRDWREADAHLRDVVLVRARQRGEEAVYVPPFDHADVWEGHSFMVDEVKAQLEGLAGEGACPDVLVCSVGGGGLFNGVVQGVERVGGKWMDATLLAVETKGADSLAESLRQGQHVSIPGITSLATSLGATKVSAKTFDLATTREQVRSVVLTDDEAAMGCWRLAEDERLIVELACGVNVALAYGGRLEKALGRPVRKEDKVVIVVCGGSAVTIDQIAEFKKTFGHLGDEVSEEAKQVVPSAATNGVKH